jgi:hypothetical protein
MSEQASRHDLVLAKLYETIANNKVAQLNAATLHIPLELYTQFLIDPVMAAKVLLGWDMDEFQKVRLRACWWIPEVIDSSGVSTGKTFGLFLFAILRALLLPNQQVFVYLPTKNSGVATFWPYFKKTMARSPHRWFERQSEWQKGCGRYGEDKEGGWYKWHLLNGSCVTMPPGNFIQDGDTQAGLRANTLVVDEWLRVENMGDAIDAQLIDRVTAPNLNQHHPIWGNHQLFSGHAETPAHKGYARYKSFMDAIRDGSQRHGLISFCFHDISPKWRKILLQEEHVESRRKTLARTAPGRYKRQYLGLWRHDGSTFYPPAVLRQCLARTAPQVRRASPLELFFLGVDIAMAGTSKADFTALTILRSLVVPAAQSTLEYRGTYYHSRYVYSVVLKGRTLQQLSGLVYDLDSRFNFEKIVLDPLGGGFGLHDEFQKERQLINNVETPVVPICIREHPEAMLKRAKVVYFHNRRAGEILDCVNPDFLLNPEGLVDAAHRDWREGWENRHFEWPMPLEDRPSSDTELWLPEQLEVQRYMDHTFSQVERIRVRTHANGTHLQSKRGGYNLFESPTKKDAAYSAMYAHQGFVLWRYQYAMNVDGEPEGNSFYAG